MSEAEVAPYYAEHAGEFAAPETVTVRQILVPTANEARDVRRRLQKRPQAASRCWRRRVSRGPEASTGGLMGTLRARQLPPELEAAAFALAAGATSDVVQTPLGYHVLRVDARAARARAEPGGVPRPRSGPAS